MRISDWSSDVVLFRSLDPAPLARQLDGALVGLGATVGEEHAVETRRAGQPLRQLDRRHVVERRRRVHELVGLLKQGALHFGCAMAQGVHGPALHEVEISLASMVLQPRALASHEHEVRTGGDLHSSEEHTSELQSLTRTSYAVF